MRIQDFGEGGLELIKPRLPTCKPHLSVGKINAVKGANKSWLDQTRGNQECNIEMGPILTPPPPSPIQNSALKNIPCV